MFISRPSTAPVGLSSILDQKCNGDQDELTEYKDQDIKVSISILSTSRHDGLAMENFF